MRPYPAILSLLCLAACGGGGDSNAPEIFHVGVIGEGSGSGHIRATQGANVNCAVGEGSSCNLSLASGTDLRLEATADPNSAFLRWDSDASSCGTQTSCSITVTRDMVVTGRFEAEAEGIWSGPVHDNDGTTIGTLQLTLSETNGVVTGNGTLGNAGVSNSLSASGTYVPPSLSITLSTPGFADINLTATVAKTSMAGQLNGSGFINASITLNRQ